MPFKLLPRLDSSFTQTSDQPQVLLGHVLSDSHYHSQYHMLVPAEQTEDLHHKILLWDLLLPETMWHTPSCAYCWPSETDWRLHNIAVGLVADWGYVEYLSCAYWPSITDWRLYNIAMGLVADWGYVEYLHNASWPQLNRLLTLPQNTAVGLTETVWTHNGWDVAASLVVALCRIDFSKTFSWSEWNQSAVLVCWQADLGCIKWDSWSAAFTLWSLATKACMHKHAGIGVHFKTDTNLQLA